MNCNLYRDQNGNITRVVATQTGNESLLYKEALKTMSIKDALSLWSISQTPLFKNEVKSKLDKNGEPKLKDVLAYIVTKANVDVLTPAEKVEVVKSMIGTKYGSSKSLAIKVKDALLMPTRVGLAKLELYNDTEINDILRNITLRDNILRTAQKIINTEENLYNTIEVDDLYKTIDTTKKDILGKYLLINPFITEKEVIDTLGGIVDKNEFETALKNSEFEFLKSPQKDKNRDNKATTKLVTEYLKAKLGQDISILSEKEMFEELKSRGYDSLQAMVIGKRGAEELDLINNSRKMLNLKIAKDMYKIGKSAKEIKIATGWEVGAERDTLLDLYSLQQTLDMMEEAGVITKTDC